MFSDKDASYQAETGVELDGDYIFFDDTKLTPRAMRNFLRSMMTQTDQLASGTVMSNSLFTPIYGVHMYSFATGYSGLSQLLPYGSEGMTLVIDGLGLVGDANIEFFASTGGGVTGVSVVLPTGSAVSSINMSAVGYLKLFCTTDGTWAILEKNASVTANKAS